jgi:predicted membrane protein
MINVGKASNPKQSLLVAVSGILMGPKYVLLLSALRRGGVILFC